MRRSSHAHVGARSAGPAVAAIGRGQERREAAAAAAGSRGLRRFPVAPSERRPVMLTYAIQDYAGDDALPAEIETFVHLGDLCHYRMHFAEAYCVGHSEFCGLEDGFFVHISDMTFAAPCPMSVLAPNMLRIRIASDGDGEYASARGDVLDIRGAGAAIIIEPPGLPPAEAAFMGRCHAVQVYIHRDTLRHLYAQGEQELPAVLQAFAAGNLQRTVARRLPLVPGLLRCLEDLHGCGLAGHSRRLFIRSKAVEILCHAFEALAQEDDFGSTEVSALTTRGVLKAQRLLMENFVTPPSLDDLAHQVGLSRSGLCAGFRQIVGLTVFDYIGDLRMQHALALLNQRNASITQIAYAVGYTHPSSFSVAVQRRFGTTPSALRRRGPPAV